MKQKKFLITIPYMNKSAYLNRCLNSLLRQTVRDFDVLITDDGSRPEEYTRLLELSLVYANKGLNIRVIKNERNRGLFWSRWNMFKVAYEENYEWVFPVDPDDSISSHCIEELSVCSEKDDKLDVMYFAIATHYTDFTEVYDFENFWMNSGSLREVYADKDSFRSPFMLCTKTSFLYKIYPTEEVMKDFPKLVYQEDVTLTGLALTVMNPHIYFIDKILYNYFLDTGESCINTFDKDKEYKKACLKQMEDAFVYLKNHGVVNTGLKYLKDVELRYEKDYVDTFGKHSAIYDEIGEIK